MNVNNNLKLTMSLMDKQESLKSDHQESPKVDHELDG
jgi:hypothetical protein